MTVRRRGRDGCTPKAHAGNARLVVAKVVRRAVAALGVMTCLSVAGAHAAWAQTAADRAPMPLAGRHRLVPSSTQRTVGWLPPALSVTARDERKGDRLAMLRALLGADPRVATFSPRSPVPTRQLPKRAFSHDAVRTASGWEVP